MLQFFFEIIVAVLAVYGGYTALHELSALICQWIGGVDPQECAQIPSEQEDTHRGEQRTNPEQGGSDHPGGNN